MYPNNDKIICPRRYKFTCESSESPRSKYLLSVNIEFIQFYRIHILWIQPSYNSNTVHHPRKGGARRQQHEQHHQARRVWQHLAPRPRQRLAVVLHEVQRGLSAAFGRRSIDVKELLQNHEWPTTVPCTVLQLLMCTVLKSRCIKLGYTKKILNQFITY